MKQLSAYFYHIVRSSFITAKALFVDTIKFGPPFSRVLRELEASQWYSREQFEELQCKKLQMVVSHAYEKVPYYHELFNSLGLKPQDIRRPADLKKLPLLDKATVRKHAREFIATDAGRWMIFPGWTTGTTGTPINVVRDRNSIVAENAMIWRQRRLIGLGFRTKRVAVWETIWDNVIVPGTMRAAPFWQHNLTDNSVLFSNYHMSDTNLPEYVKLLKKFQPESIEGFPSTLLVLARYLKKTRTVIPVKAVFTTSEVLYAAHRKELEEAFAAKVFELYGQSERVVAATECEQHNGLHINPEYGIFEVLKDGEDAPPGTTGEVVGTGFNNYTMPLIRYRTGDLATLSTTPCPCGRQMPLIASLQGRLADVIRTPEGRVVPGNSVMDALYGVRNVKRSQLIQERLDRVVLHVETEDPAQPLDCPALKQNLIRCLGTSMDIEIRVVDEIETNGQTKYRWMISRLPAEQVA